MKMFPMQGGPPIHWETAEVVYRAYSYLHGKTQTLERLAERGGFGWGEVQYLFKELEGKHYVLWKELMGKK